MSVQALFNYKSLSTREHNEYNCQRLTGRAIQHAKSYQDMSKKRTYVMVAQTDQSVGGSPVERVYINILLYLQPHKPPLELSNLHEKMSGNH